MSFAGHFRALTTVQRNTFSACFLGWTLDAFDFFLLTFCLTAIAAGFHSSRKQVEEAIFWTLAMRPVGAFLFGAMAERLGRRPTLIVNVVAFSAFELASALAPTLHSFLVCRALFGIAMGGVWGVGAALALESLPAQNRGFFSGLLQEGYVCGNLLAALLFAAIFPHLHGAGMLANWRVLFMIGALPALLAFYLNYKVEESPAWLATHRGHGSTAAQMRPRVELKVWFGYLPIFLFLILLMSAFTSFSHGTQDLYPTFLQHDMHQSPSHTGLIAAVGNIGALLGGVCCGALSEKLGRRRTIVLVSLLAIPMVPLWAWSHSGAMLAAGGFLIQFMVQGAWGIIPAHLNELSPAPVRAVLPGFAYQLGNLLSSRNQIFQQTYADHHNAGALNVALSGTVVVVAIVVAGVTALGPEAKGADLG
ncbi:MAG: MFS transporter [Acidobacteriaceae bacterium]|jgi:SHS family lactate transporter-like MFS transporter